MTTNNNNNNTTTLEWLRAAQVGDVDTLQRLLRHHHHHHDGNTNNDANAAVHVRDSLRQTALHAACRHGHAAVVTLLLDHGAPVHTARRGGWTPLHTAAAASRGGGGGAVRRSEQEEERRDDDENRHDAHDDDDSLKMILRALLRAGADAEARLCNGQTALHVAVAHGNVPAVRQLLCHHHHHQHGDPSSLMMSSSSATDKRGWTVLHTAAFYGQVSVVAYLLSSSMSMLSRDLIQAKAADGSTAFHLAAASQHVRRTVILRCLHEASSSSSTTVEVVDAVDDAAQTALSHAVMRHDVPMTRFLLFTCGATVRIRDLIRASRDDPDVLYALTTVAAPQGLFRRGIMRMMSMPHE